MKKLLLGICFFIVIVPVLGQKAELFISDDSILIGEPTVLTLKINSTKETVVFPIFKDSIGSKVEILKVGKIDTTVLGNEWEFVQQIQITSFDSGTYVIPYQTIFIQDSLIKTHSLQLNVNHVKIDLQKNIQDIAPIIEAPLTWKEILWLILKWIIIALSIVFIFMLIKRFYIKYQNNNHQKEVLPIQRPFMEEFWERYSELENAQFWQKGNVKEHYSKASELMRSYLEYRYQINALENTTSNILQQLRGMSLNHLVYEKIKQSLLFADMVKFAKAQGVKEQHEKVLINIKELVSETAIGNEQ